MDASRTIGRSAARAGRPDIQFYVARPACGSRRLDEGRTKPSTTKDPKVHEGRPCRQKPSCYFVLFVLADSRIEGFHRARARTRVTSSGCSLSPIHVSTAIVTIWL